MLGTPREAIRDFENQLREKKYASEAATRYGLAYAHYRNRDWVAVEREAGLVVQARLASPIPERLLAEARIAQGDFKSGLQLYREAMLRFPLNQALQYGYAATLIGARAFDEALRFVELQLQHYPEDIRFHKLRAESYAGLGRMAQQHLALGEMFALQGRTAAAVEQMELAQKAGDADFYAMSVIDTRLRELKRQRLDEIKERRN
jgi:predicted Zn-dependent protease